MVRGIRPHHILADIRATAIIEHPMLRDTEATMPDMDRLAAFRLRVAIHVPAIRAGLVEELVQVDRVRGLDL